MTAPTLTDPTLTDPAAPGARGGPGSPGASPTAWAVALCLPLGPLDFGVPHGFAGPAPVGHRVAVPWQGELKVGLVVGPGQGTSSRVRDAVALLDPPDGPPWVNPAFLAAADEEARLGRVPLGALIDDLVGVGLAGRLAHRVRAVPGADLAAFGANTPTDEWQDAARFDAALLDAVRAQGLLDERVADEPRTVEVIRSREGDGLPLPTRSVLRARETGDGPLTPKGAVAWAWLRDRGEVASLSEWADLARVGTGVVSGVLARGWAEKVEVPAPPPAAWTWLREHGHAPSLSAWAAGSGHSAAQVTQALTRGWAERVRLPAPPPPLPAPGAPPRPTPDRLPEAPEWRLHGGRPATRWRLLAARVGRELEIGRAVLVVVPEHAALRRAWEHLSGVAAAGFGDGRGRAVQVSGLLGDAEREETWRLVRSGEARLVIGTPAALCAPLPDLALLIVDDEGSDAHKLRAGGGAFVPDLARRLAGHADAALCWTGPSPSAEVLDAPGVVLPAPPARLHVVDYGSPPEAPELGPLSRRDLAPAKQGYPLSHDLARVLRQVAERGRQAVLLAPRRGYSALLRCPSCEHVPMCKHCDVPLRFHQDTRALTCHQCGYHEAVHDRCEKCGDPMWQARGPGTEWIAGEVRKLLPDFPVLRFDKDRQDDLSPLRAGQSAVVVGTQALLGQDAPPNLALIGVTLADTWLGVSDFRASERYHRLLRALLEWHPERAPLLVVQTFQARHPALLSVLNGEDAGAYGALERAARRALRYPPFARLAQIEVSARDPDRARSAAEAVAAALYTRGAQDAELLGPAPSPVARLRGVYPYHLLLRVRDEARLDALLGALDRTRFGGRVRVDVQPRGGFGL